MHFQIIYKNISSKKVRIFDDNKVSNVLKYKYFVRYRMQGTSKIRFRDSGYSFDTEQQAKEAMNKFINELEGVKEKKKEEIVSPEDFSNFVADFRSKNNLGKPEEKKMKFIKGRMREVDENGNEL
jgi:hypothetical protein